MTDSIEKSFGIVLKHFRELNMLTQDDFSSVIDRTYFSELERGLKSPTLKTIDKISQKLNIHPTLLVSLAYSIKEGNNYLKSLSNLEFDVNKSKIANFKYHEDNSFNPEDILKSIKQTNEIIVIFNNIFKQATKTRLFEVIDKKQTGAFLGAIFVDFMAKNCDYLVKNPSQTGHPDLIPSKYKYGQEKVNWDQFPYGGIEAKTSSGDLKTGKTYELKIGEPRIDYITNVVWKGHHQEINNLLALYWDYYKGPPAFLGCFYSNNLVPNDFTNTVPQPSGGHTTSVCITKKSARDKLMKDWVAVAKIGKYEKLFEKFGALNKAKKSALKP